MWKNRLALLAALVSSIGLARGALAEITMIVTGVTLSGPPGSPAQALHDNGWQGFLLTLSADADSRTIGGFDFDSQSQYLNWYSTIPLDYGITGTLAQVWHGTNSAKGAIPSPTGTLPLGSTTSNGDSFFSNSLASTEHAIRPFSEDFNGGFDEGPAPPNPPYDHYPVSDTDDTHYGFADWMRGAGTISGPLQTATLPFAFVIAPLGESVHVKGQVADGTAGANTWLLDFSFNQPMEAHALLFGQPAPEPGSLLTLAGGAGIAMLKRRRRMN